MTATIVLQPWMPLVILVVLFSVLVFLRKPGRGGAIGRAVRGSDWMAWRDAMDEKEMELEQLRQQEPKG